MIPWIRFSSSRTPTPVLRGRPTARLVQRIGADTRIYSHVSEVLEDIERGNIPDAILADLNGFGSADHDDMRRIVERHPGVPIYIISGVGQEEVDRAAASIGAAGSLAKPYSMAQLRALLRRVPAIDAVAK